jgi:hypothetical protein
MSKAFRLFRMATAPEPNDKRERRHQEEALDEALKT